MSAGPQTANDRGKSAWPGAAQFNEAVQNLATSMCDAELKGGEAQLGPLGLPMPYSGNFADVYKVYCPATRNTWALKFFKREVRDLRQRYHAISEALRSSQLPFMVDFHYLEQGVRIGVAWYPLLKMRWIEGQSLNRFVAQKLDSPRTLDQLSGLWIRVAARLRQAGIAHADLQHGNVVLVPESEGGRLLLKLIDYDGMYVPALSDQRSGEVGHPAYQHPRRTKEGIYSVDVDRFSHLAICCALRCLSVGRKPLWERFDNGDNLLFTEQDFASPPQSDIFQRLWKLPDPAAQALTGHLALATQRTLEQIPPIEELVRDGEVRLLSPAERQAVQALLEGRSSISLEGLIAVDVPPTNVRDAQQRERLRSQQALDRARDQLVLDQARQNPLLDLQPVRSDPPVTPARIAPPALVSATPSRGWSAGKALFGGAPNNAWGIEVGQCSLKALCCQLNDDGSVTPTAYDFIEHAKILSQPDADGPALIRAALALFASRSAVQNAAVAITAAGQTALCRFFTLPPVDKKKVADIVKFEAKQQIPFPLEDVVWDWQPLHRREEIDGFAFNMKIGLFAMKRDQIDLALLPVLAAGLTTDVIQASSMAIFNTLAADLRRDGRSPDTYDLDHPPDSLLALSMGTDATDCIITDGVQPWHRCIPMGGNHFTRQLAKEMKLTFAKAEHLKRNVTQSADPKAVFQAMRPVFNDLLSEVQRSIGYFTSINRKANIRGLIFLGNATKLPGLRMYLSKNLNFEVLDLPVMNWLAAQPALAAPLFRENLSAFGVCFGLCLQALDRAAIRANLLPPERRAGLLKQVRNWIGRR